MDIDKELAAITQQLGKSHAEIKEHFKDKNVIEGYLNLLDFFLIRTKIIDSLSFQSCSNPRNIKLKMKGKKELNSNQIFILLTFLYE